MKTGTPLDIQPTWQGTLSDYVTAIAWSPDGHYLAASSAAGDVVLIRFPGLQVVSLQAATGSSVDCLAFSLDSHFLAMSGQTGQITVWSVRSRPTILMTTLAHPSVWVDRLCWSPTRPVFAVNLGKCAQVWDADTQAVVATLHFEDSTVLDLDWRQDGQYLAIAGYQGTKVWNSYDWQETATRLESPSATVAIAWSPDHHFLAAGNLDSTLCVLEWGNPDPWLMRGFPGKVRQLAWSEVADRNGTPLLAACSGSAIVVWQRDLDETIGWTSQVLRQHDGMVHAIAFQPGSRLLASAAEDGWVALWHRGNRLTQVLTGAVQGFSCLAWHPQGQQLAAGGLNGELLIWSQPSRGRGFGTRSGY